MSLSALSQRSVSTIILISDAKRAPCDMMREPWSVRCTEAALHAESQGRTG